MDKRKYFKLLIVFIFAFSLAETVQAQNRILTLSNADAEFDRQNYWGALDLYRSLYEKDKKDAKVLYRMGECHLFLKNYQIALSFLEDAKELDAKVDKDLDFTLGKTYHHLAKLDEALEHFKAFRNEGRSNNNYYQIEKRIKQCKYAKEMMANPVDVKINNLGSGINSQYDDYAPAINAKGDFMVFTSRRITMSKGRIDVRGDYKHFEDVYFSYLREDGTWETSETLSETINTDGHDAVLSLTPNGKGIFLYRNNENSRGDIFYSDRKGEFEWTEPVKLEKPINTIYFESSVSITQDGNTMYFISERPGGEGRGDIYVSKKLGENKWGKPKNLGDRINTKGDEKFVFIHPKGNILFFASEGHRTMGSYDIFRCVLEGNKWSKPVNLGYPINTVNEESTFSMTRDNKKLLISAEYEGGLGERDIYEVDLSNFDILKAFELSEDILTKTNTIRVYGRVLAKGRNISNISVDVLDSKSEELVAQFSSDDLGNFEVELSKGASYLLRVNDKAYEKYDKRLSLKSDLDNLTDLERDIELRPKN
ncbi:MAG: hypothetical protein AAF487_11110 [Bacteroidota bacterium]